MIRPDGIFTAGILFLAPFIQGLPILKTRAPFLLVSGTWSAILTSFYHFPVPHSSIAKFYQGKTGFWWPVDERFSHVALSRVLFCSSGYFSIFGRLSGLFLVSVKSKIAHFPQWLYVCAWSAAYFAAYSFSSVPAYGNYFFPLVVNFLLVGGFPLILISKKIPQIIHSAAPIICAPLLSLLFWAPQSLI